MDTRTIFLIVFFIYFALLFLFFLRQEHNYKQYQKLVKVGDLCCFYSTETNIYINGEHKHQGIVQSFAATSREDTIYILTFDGTLVARWLDDTYPVFGVKYGK